jgi:hypothetical protein
MFALKFSNLSFVFMNLFTLYAWLTHGAEPFLTSRQLCSYSRTFQHFMEPEGSVPCSQEPSTGPCPRLHEHFRNKLTFYDEEVLPPRPTPKRDQHELSSLFASCCVTWDDIRHGRPHRRNTQHTLRRKTKSRRHTQEDKWEQTQN